MTTKLLSLGLLLLTFNYSKAQSQYIDTSFGTNNGYTFQNQAGDSNLTFMNIEAINGSIYVTEHIIGGDVFISKYDDNGILDTSFGTSGILNLNENDSFMFDASYLSQLTTSSDGKLLVVSSAYAPEGFSDNFSAMISKINLDGTFDATYGANGQFICSLPNGINHIGSTITDTDAVLSVGYNTSYTNNDYTQKMTIIKVDGTGNLDTSFGINGSVDFAYPYQTYTPWSAIFKGDDLYLLFKKNTDGDSYIAKYNLNTLSYDSSFGTGGTLQINTNNQNEIALGFLVDDNDDIIVAGRRVSTGSLQNQLFVYKYNNNYLDITFGTAGAFTYQLMPGVNSSMSNISIKKFTNKLLISGTFYDYTGATNNSAFFTQLNNDGTLDTTFGNNGTIRDQLFTYSAVYDYLNYDNALITCGSCNAGAGAQVPCLMKFLKDPTLNTTNEAPENLSIYPNPTNRYLHVNISDTINQVSIYDTTGRLITQTKVTQNTLDLDTLQSGVYMITAKTATKQYTFKVAKN